MTATFPFAGHPPNKSARVRLYRMSMMWTRNGVSLPLQVENHARIAAGKKSIQDADSRKTVLSNKGGFPWLTMRNIELETGGPACHPRRLYRRVWAGKLHPPTDRGCRNHLSDLLRLHEKAGENTAHEDWIRCAPGAELVAGQENPTVPSERAWAPVNATPSLEAEPCRAFVDLSKEFHGQGRDAVQHGASSKCVDDLD